MELIIRLMFIIGVIFIVIGALKSNNDSDSSKFKKVIIFLVRFISYFIIYYFIIAIVSSIPLYFITGNGDGSDSGVWAYGLILGATLSPVLSLITTIRHDKKRGK